MSAYLLDTHSLLWWWTDASLLGSGGRRVLEARAHKVIVSAASVWEIAVKSAAGKLDMIEDFQRDYPILMAENGFPVLAMTDLHSLAAGFLPGSHRDPFDRMLAAQALAENLTLISRDPELAGFGCRTIW